MKLLIVLTVIITGCMNPNYLEYDSLANDNDISLVKIQLLMVVLMYSI